MNKRKRGKRMMGESSRRMVQVLMTTLIVRLLHLLLSVFKKDAI